MVIVLLFIFANAGDDAAIIGADVATGADAIVSDVRTDADAAPVNGRAGGAIIFFWGGSPNQLLLHNLSILQSV